ncbi:MAG TPA: hypothetical protein VJC21_02275 [Candidatus Nanoarchaeia archaeon]|nr:hypothetical protein [Candidatus Nanoarchaeia archaeon]
MAVFIDVKKEAGEKLLKQGFKKEEPRTLYEELRLSKNGVTAILYATGTLLLQGKADAIEKAAKQLSALHIGEEKSAPSFNKETGWVIGSDESLKGDTFGGIVVAAVKADKAIREKLAELGVADSKTLRDEEILPLAEQIKHLAPCEVQSLLPEEYNQQHGVTHLLNKLHASAAQHLAPGKHIVDKYPGCAVGDLATEKAESKYVEVAAASILARAAALQQLNQLSAWAGFPVPKGSTHVQDALKKLREKKLDFEKFVKIDFRNVKEFLERA